MSPTITTSHTLYFDAKIRVTPAVLAESLLGLEGIVARSGEVLRHLVPGLGTIETMVLIEKIEVGSLYDNFVVELLFGKGEKAEKKIDEFRKKLKLDHMTTGKLIAILMTGAIVYVAYLYVTLGDPEQVRIQDSFNNLSVQVNLTPDEFRDLYRGGVKNPEALKRDVVRLVRPGGQKLDGKIAMDGDHTLSVPAEVVKNIPEAYVKTEREKPEEDLVNVPIVVRALDLDRPGSGWAAVLPELRDGGEKRLPLELAPDLDPLSVPAGKIVYADVTLIFRVDRNNNRTPVRVILNRLVAPK